MLHDTLEIDFDLAARYLERLASEKVKLEPFVANGLRTRKLDDKIKGPQPETVEKLKHGGEVVWSPFKCRAKTAKNLYWPALALHVDHDRDQIPLEAMRLRKQSYTAESHKLVAYFGEHKYEWVETALLLNFAENFEEMEKQPVLAARAKYRQAIVEASEAVAEQLENMKGDEEESAAARDTLKETELKRKFATLEDVPLLTCGACKVCQCRRREQHHISSSQRRLSRQTASPSALTSETSGVFPDMCPQLEVRYHVSSI